MSPWAALRRQINRLALNDKRFAFLFDTPPADEAISIDCETTGFDPWVDDVISVAAIPVKGSRIETSKAFRAVIRPDADMRADAIKIHQLRAADVKNARPMREVLPELLAFIGPRPLIGYWIDFDCSMLDKSLLAQFNFRLPNRRIEVSKLYFDRKHGNAPPGTQIDLSFKAIRRDLGIPDLAAHDAFNDALMAAEMYVMLSDMVARGRRFQRDRVADGGFLAAGA